MHALFSISHLWKALGVSLLCFVGGYLFHKQTGERFVAGLTILAGVWLLSNSLDELGGLGDVAALLVFVVGCYLTYRYIWRSPVVR